MTENPLQLATKTWIEAVQKYYENDNELTQIYMRGYFAGWSEREILRLAEKLLRLVHCMLLIRILVWKCLWEMATLFMCQSIMIVEILA